MKNLSKVLALVLVVATLFGFATVVGATDFSDSSSVKNTEAVEVMNALGVINGYTDGSFKPGNNVTRAEMAKMVTAILNGGEDVGPLYSAANVFTDCGYHWARGYIAYATQVKLVAGIGGGKFNPDGNVTGTEAAKMLLCALGYEPEREGLVGTTWAAKTLSLAREAGLTDGFARNFDFSKPLSRDNAALLMLNALKAVMVEYGDDAGTIIVGGVEVVTGGRRASKVLIGTYDDTIEGESAYLQLGEKSFDGDLKLVTIADGDDFGRPALKWTYNKKSIGTYNNAEPVLTYTTAVKPQNIYEDLNLGAAETIAMANIYVNGAAPVSPNNKNVVLDKTDADYKTNIGYTGNGTTTEIYEVGDTYRIVVTDEYLAKVTGVVKAKGDDARKVNMTVYTGGAGTSSESFETEDFEKNDWVLVTMADGDVKSAKAADIQEDVAVTGYKAGSNVTAGGTKYEYSKVARDTIPATYNMGENDSYTFYLDSNGYVLFAEAYSATNSDYIYVLELGSAQGEFSDKYRSVKYVGMDGKVGTYKIDNAKCSATPSTGGLDTDVADLPGWYTVADDSNNSDYKVFTAAGTVSAALKDDGTNQLLSKTRPLIANGISANASTVFVLKTDTNTYTSYTGIANIPSYEVAKATAVNAHAVVEDSYAKAVYVDVTGMSGTNTAEDVIYLFDDVKDGTETDGKNTYDVHDAIVDGVETTVKVHKDYTPEATGLVKVASYDENGFIRKVAPVSGDDYDRTTHATLSADAITYSDPTLTVDGTSYLTNADTVVYIITTSASAGERVEVTTVDALVGTATGAMALVKDSSTVTEIYFAGTITNS